MQGGGVGRDRRLQGGQGPARIQAGLLRQPPPGRGVRGQGLAAPPRPVERQHVQLHQPLPQGVFGRQSGELRAHPRVPAEREVRGQRVLHAVEPFLGQPGRRGFEDPAPESGQGHRAPPGPECPAEQPAGLARVPAGLR
ncbi:MULTISPECIES: hypothetical protein [unclassified Streptomyces]|uniref:hypothetical protein n=1 Tax=unclassified Streptomyces TaxID=2593676 RepID=UPI001EF99D95|nr:MULTISPECIES: hypothetical protein [unclassified Streptomyces]